MKQDREIREMKQKIAEVMAVSPGVSYMAPRPQMPQYLTKLLNSERYMLNPRALMYQCLKKWRMSSPFSSPETYSSDPSTAEHKREEFNGFFHIAKWRHEVIYFQPQWEPEQASASLMPLAALMVLTWQTIHFPISFHNKGWRVSLQNNVICSCCRHDFYIKIHRTWQQERKIQILWSFRQTNICFLKSVQLCQDTICPDIAGPSWSASLICDQRWSQISKHEWVVYPCHMISGYLNSDFTSTQILLPNRYTNSAQCSFWHERLAVQVLLYRKYYTCKDV